MKKTRKRSRKKIGGTTPTSLDTGGDSGTEHRCVLCLDSHIRGGKKSRSKKSTRKRSRKSRRCAKRRSSKKVYHYTFANRGTKKSKSKKRIKGGEKSSDCYGYCQCTSGGTGRPFWDPNRKRCVCKKDEYSPPC